MTIITNPTRLITANIKARFDDSSWAESLKVKNPLIRDHEPYCNVTQFLYKPDKLYDYLLAGVVI